jgi:hypothetical protein
MSQLQGVSGTDGAYYLEFASSNVANIFNIRGDTGHVGIGTTSPSQNLEVYAPSAAAAIRVLGAGGQGGQLMLAGPTGANAYLVSRDNPGNGDLEFINNAYTAVNATVLNAGGFIVNRGSVGIGTTNPSQKLQIGDNSTASLGFRIAASGVNWDQTTDASGNLNISNGNGNYLTFIKQSVTSSFAGNVTVAGSINAKYQDVAEWVPASEQLAAGTVVVLDSSKSNQVTSSSTSYDTRVAGVVSEQPGIALGEKSEGKVLVATTGRVRVKVDATKVPIHIGDLLVTSDEPGVAMKSEPVEFSGRKMHMPGTIIGKALEPLASGKGEILVLLSLQ